MKIKTQLQLLVAAAIIFNIGIGWAVYQSSIQVTRAVTMHDEAMSVIKSLFTLNQLTNDYVSNPSEKALVQWHYGYEALSTPISHLTYSNIGPQDLAVRMQSDFKTLGETYTRLVAKSKNLEGSNPQGGTTSLSKNDQEVHQLATALETILADALQYHGTTQLALEATQEQINLLIMIIVIIMAVGIVLAASVLYRDIARPITELQRGTDAFAKGNLDYQVPVKGHNEIGQLAQSFNDMAQSLRAAQSSQTMELKSRKLAEQKSVITNRAYQTLSGCIQVVLRATDESQLLRAICNLLLDIGGYRLAWVGYISQSEQKTVYPVAQSGDEEGYIETTTITWDDSELGQGPTGTAIRTGTTCVAQQILTDPKYKPWRENAIKHGFVSLIALPLLSEGKAFGALNIYASEPDAFDNDEIGMLQELADDLAYGIMSLRTRAGLSHTIESLQVERDRAQMYLNIAGVILVALNHHGEITLINRKGCEILGYEEQEMIGKNWFDTCLPEAEIVAVKQVFANLMATGRDTPDSPSYINCIRTKTGEQRVIFWSNTIIHDEAGYISGTLSSGEDITEREKAQNDLIRKTEELAHSNAELEQFTRITTHDLQEPLRKMLVIASLLERHYSDKVDAKTSQYINRIIEGVNRMYTIITGLQEYMQARGGNYPLTLTNFDAVLRQAVLNLDTDIQNYHAQVTSDPLPMLIANFSQMVILFDNLIGNALKFHGPQKPQIHVSATQEDGCFVFSVRDNGIGIEPQYADQIFSIFRRLHGSDKYPGTGIGLAISKLIVERHGGRIWVESEEGNGSVFYFILPEKIKS